MGVVHVAHLKQGEIRAHKKRGCESATSFRIHFPTLGYFFEFFFWGGDRSSKISNKQWRGFEDFEFCSDVFFQNKESSSYSNIPKGSMFGTIRIFETLE